MKQSHHANQNLENQGHIKMNPTSLKTKNGGVYSLVVQCLAVLLISLISAGEVYAQRTTTFFHTDGLGSVVAASDKNGKLLWRKSYMPYGAQTGDTSEPLSYTGKPHDESTGLTYFGARYYDPELRRFISTDPVGFMESNPMSFNRYAYANNSPYKYADPDGREPHRWTDGNYSDNDGQENPGWSTKINKAYSQVGSGLAEAWQYHPAFIVGSGEAVFGAGALLRDGLGSLLKGGITRELGSASFYAKNGIGNLFSPNVVLKGETMVFNDFAVGTARGLMGFGAKGAAELAGPLKEMVKFAQKQGASKISLQGKYVSAEGAALGGGKIGDSFSFSFSATNDGVKQFLKSLSQ